MQQLAQATSELKYNRMNTPDIDSASSSVPSYNSNMFQAHIQGPPSDSYQVHKVLAGGTSGEMETEPAVIAVAGDYTKVNYRAILTDLVSKYKET